MRSPTSVPMFTQKNHALAAEVLQKCRFCVPRSARARKKYGSGPAWGSKSVFLQHLCSQSAIFFGTLAAEVLQSAKIVFPR